MAEYMEADVSDWNMNQKIATYDKDMAEKEIARMEKIFGPRSEKVKENIRNRFVYVGKDKE